jgi:osmotically-inducible protein OsmY
MKKILTLLTIALSLQSCIFIAGAAAGAAGIAIVYDHRKVEKVLQDQRISNTASDKIKSIADLDQDSNINVTCFNQVILLTGETPSSTLRQEAEDAAKSVPGVNHVYNEIMIKGPSSSLTRASDAWITAKIKTQMLATKGLQSSTIKVVTENGSVYLMGIVSRRQADITVKIAREVTGVQRVVKIFQYTD